MKREHRLRKNHDFQQLYREGCKVRLQGLVVYARPNSSHGHRMGMIISHKMGTAVVRNRWKRRMRTFWSNFLENITTSCDILWIATHPQVAQIPFSELQKRVLHGFEQLSQKWPNLLSEKK
ncbi:MAG: ribonuclease P protein component [Opitutales bacterium]|nr:ribonuclease P protein component [Opitutales bacterium]